MWVHVTIAVILLLWPTDIGPEPTPGPPTDKKPPPGNGPPFGMDKFGNQDQIPIDRDQFIASFKRQAQGELTECLRKWQSTPNSAAVAGVLFKNGILRSIHAIDQTRPLPPCANEIVKKMDFAAIAKPLKQDSQALQWRIDW